MKTNKTSKDKGKERSKNNNIGKVNKSKKNEVNDWKKY